MKIAIMGYGTIGSGVAAVVERNAASIAKRVGEPIEVKYVLDLREFPGDPIQEKVVHDIDVIVNDPEVAIVVETMGGVEPACTFVKKALAAGKSVTTSNKALVAKKGIELLDLAKENHVSFLFEASVGGGIPIIRPLNQCLTADEILEITGILNGTTNYMLTKMDREGVTFDEVLKEAQDKGYAEKDPTADIEGFDACRKIAILSSLAYGSQVDFEDIYTEGITKITDTDFKYARKMGTSIKLFGTSKRAGEEFYAMVAPVMINADHPLYAVNDVFNGIMVEGNMVDKLMFYGRGAGSLPTASAVVADVVEMAKNPHTTLVTSWSTKKLPLADKGTWVRKFFVRAAENTEEKKAQVEAAFGPVSYIELEGLNEFAFVTPEMAEAEYEKKAAFVDGILQMIRMDV
ncbi:homoserine dehydrogenase [Fusibacillus kribbianus]|uniref:Homoserine dehydrogenase n=1 Tax=Fusibacillus kribbianus TaxID=3044208 RepID=A0AAP4B9H8_9FIRM|nr:homoserine dehydrogenase [Ruminococcus sp. YH-rum2234]MDI9242521.1 homoserine dehydrogenase [Ruminococcus sp. YH-rum2234]